MNKEPKACPLCGKQPQGNNWHTYGRNPKDEMRYFCADASCPGGFRKALTLDEWNTRPLEDALRAELAAANAEIARLRASWWEEHTERIRLEERLKLANATVEYMVKENGYDSEADDDEVQSQE